MTVTSDLLGYAQAAIGRVRAIHKPFGIYEECNHDHTDEDVADGQAVNVNEVGLTCDDGLMYRICMECCVDGEEYQSERCMDSHEHSKVGPICATIAALDGVQ